MLKLYEQNLKTECKMCIMNNSKCIIKYTIYAFHKSSDFIYSANITY